ncbi:MAG: circadian clock protein KaiC, partial [Legionella sp.]|nr:circadian clock protein KaiC [Legionella sp.]
LLNKPTLIKGGPGTGKTIFTLFFIHAQIQNGSSVIIVSCDEAPANLISYMDYFGLSGTEFKKSGKLTILDFRPQINEEVSGAYELDMLLFRIIQAKNKINAQALVVDSIQDLLLGLHECNKEIELLKLFSWSRSQKMTFLSTIAESTNLLKAELLEEYAVDCVIKLKQHLNNNLMTRYLRVVKLRGASYGTNEYPFTILAQGVSILPITDTRLNTPISKKYISTGIKQLDLMLDNKGYQEGSSVMFTGRSGTAKTIFAATLSDAAIKKGKKVLYVSFEESPDALMHHLLSVDIDFERHVKNKKLIINSRRTIEMGLEEHIISIVDLVEKNGCDIIVLDPISAFIDMGSLIEIKLLLIRFISYMKAKGHTQIFTELIPDFSGEFSNLSLSSMTDTWIRLRQVENNGEYNRLISVVKSRGTKTSNQIKEFLITHKGIFLEDPYIGDNKMLFGSAKYSQILKDEELADTALIQIAYLEEKLKLIEEEFHAQQKMAQARYTTQKQHLAFEKSEIISHGEKFIKQSVSNKRLRE